MTSEHHFGGTRFHGDFLWAFREPEGEVRFTRSERAVLSALAGNARRVMSRNQLLDAISGAGSDAADRNIDFIVNRLRAKLGDRARAPRFIATQYGEGYVWIAGTGAAANGSTTGAAPAEVMLHIGPVYGLERTPSSAGAAMLAALRERLAAAVNEGQSVVLVAPERPRAPAPPEARFTLEVSFYAAAPEAPLHGALVLREGRSGRIVRALRQTITAADTAADHVATVLRTAMWERMSFTAGEPAAPTDVPLELRLHDAARLLTREPESWIETEAQTTQAFTDRPDDPEAALAMGMSLYSRLLFSPYSPHVERAATARTEDEIERLVLASLPRIEDDPILALAAAKLLLFVRRDHHALAERLAENAFASSTAFAPAFSTLGQVRMYQGQIGEALDLYERAIELAERGSQFEVYLMSLCCIAHLASGNRMAVRRACERIFAAHPSTEARLGPFVMPKNEVNSPVIARFLGALTPERLQGTLRYAHYVSGRLFHHEAHRENVLRDLSELCASRHGAAAVPDEVRESVPRLMAELGASRVTPAR